MKLLSYKGFPLTLKCTFNFQRTSPYSKLYNYTTIPIITTSGCPLHRDASYIYLALTHYQMTNFRLFKTERVSR